jgi:hypothetical protein
MSELQEQSVQSQLLLAEVGVVRSSFTVVLAKFLLSPLTSL